MKSWISTALLAGAWCAGCSYPRTVSQQDLATVAERARARVLAERPSLDEASKTMIRTNAPRVGYYSLTGGDYAQYEFSWRITSNRVARLWGQGLFSRLEGATVTVSESANYH